MTGDAIQKRLRALFREGGHEQVVAVAHEAARKGRAAELPDGLPAALREALLAAGIKQLHGHQRAAFDALRAGENVVISTGTASGKSLCYQLAVLDEYARDPQSRALLLFPTKALAQDQARKLGALRMDAPGIRPAVPAIYDGDTPMDSRALLRRTATILLSNPDMLHVGILPSHERWAEYLHHLRFVVLDEAHVYRGVFGSHVAQVVRRLRRLCAQYGGSPQFVLTSATIATQALELGIDVGTLDVSLVTGFPGTVTSLRQRWGRAGRIGHGWAVLVAGQDALDQYFMREPERLLSRGVEEAIIDLHNPHISARHLEAAAYERPITPKDEAYFGEQGLLAAERLAQAGRLRRRGDGLSGPGRIPPPPTPACARRPTSSS